MRLDGLRAWIGRGVCLLATMMLMPADSARAQQKQNEPDGTKADVMFVLDITGSMGFAIEGVENGLEKILKKLKDNGIDARVGLTVFRDQPPKTRSPNDRVAGIRDDPFTFKFGNSHFTSSSRDYRRVVSRIKAEGGGDIPENSL